MHSRKKALKIFLAASLLSFAMPAGAFGSEGALPSDNKQGSTAVLDEDVQAQEAMKETISPSLSYEESSADSRESTTENDVGSFSGNVENFNIPSLSDSDGKNADQVTPIVRYASHVSSFGWQDAVTSGQTSGTTGRLLSIEALKVDMEGSMDEISVQAHVSNLGWLNPVSGGVMAGTTGKNLAMEAVRLSLSGDIADRYDLCYRAHVSNVGWLDWAVNGEAAGSAGFRYGLEAIEIVLVEKGSQKPGEGMASFKENVLTIQAHVSSEGWQSPASEGSIVGTTGRSLALESLRVKASSTVWSGSVLIQGYVQHSGWQDEVVNGEIGTTGRFLALQAICLGLDGSLAEQYDIYYRAHVSTVGWLGWAKNGETAGSLGYGLAIEAVQILLVPKGENAPGSINDHVRSRGLNYQAHVADTGWLGSVGPGETGGTVERNRGLEALCVSLGESEYAGSIVVQTHVRDFGWQGEVSDGALAGTTGLGLPIEAMCVRLEGDIENYYDIYYRVHSSNLGWLDWASNGQVAGTTGCTLKAEAVQIVLVEKGGNAPGQTAEPSRFFAFSSSSSVRGLGWQNSVGLRETIGTTGQGRAIEQINMTTAGSSFGGSIEYAVHSADIGWQNFVTQGTIAGIEGKQVEAVKISLTGELSSIFDVYYRAHVQDMGWMDWAVNGASAGTSCLGYQLEALQIVIVPKGFAAPGSMTTPYRDTIFTANVPCIYQMPELPTGCESVSLVITLRSMGYNVSKTEIADFYLERSPWDYVNAFAGDPYSYSGNYNGAMPPALVNAANRYLLSHGASEKSRDITGTSFESLYSYIDHGYPVMVWTTTFMQNPLFTGKVLFGYRWYNNEHCVVMCDYDRSTNAVLISDPLDGIVWRDASSFGDLYRRCGSMAMVIT